MKAVMLMFDSLNRHMLPPYNADTWVHAPNFRRLAERSVTFDTSYVCSMPCMPARRDFHTGRPGFMHRDWGPLEPFDDSVPQMLSQAGVQTHLATDHYHYFENPGAGYNTRYRTWEFFRGQEGDPWLGQVAEPQIPEHINGKGRRQDWVNRRFMQREEDLPQSQTVAAGLKYIGRNHDQDNWFLQIECFDPHEPFVSNEKYEALYPSDYDGPLFDWPAYGPVKETPEQVAELKRKYAASMSKCDASLGQVLDAFDRHNLWEDTMLILWTDHGFMLGEHDAWAKNWCPLYEPISHTPFFICDPRRPETAGQRRSALVQPALDLGPTLLEFFGLEPTERMLGKDLSPVIERDQPVREAAIFGYRGSPAYVTDGRYVYMRDVVAPEKRYDYTLASMSLPAWYSPESIAGAQVIDPLPFTKGRRVWKVSCPGKGKPVGEVAHALYDVQADPGQQQKLDDPAAESRMAEHLRRLLKEADAPDVELERLGLPGAAAASATA